MELSLEKTLKAVKKEIESLKEKFNKIADAILNEKKPAKKTPAKKTAVKEKTVAKKKAAPKKKIAAKKAPVKKAAKKAVAKKTTVKKAPVKKPADVPTAFDTVIGIISNSNEGVNVATIATETRFDAKKIANIIFKAKKKGLIKSAAKGVYVKA